MLQDRTILAIFQKEKKNKKFEESFLIDAEVKGAKDYLEKSETLKCSVCQMPCHK